MKERKKIILACDLSIQALVNEVTDILMQHGMDVTNAGESGIIIEDFSKSAELVATGIQDGKYDRGVVFCGTGVGACVAANKFHGIRAGLAYDILPAAVSCIDFDTNVLCTGSWTMKSAEQCARMIETWVMVSYAGQNSGMIEKIKQAEERC